MNLRLFWWLNIFLATTTSHIEDKDTNGLF